MKNYENITTLEAAGAVHGRNPFAMTHEILTNLGIDAKFQKRLISDYQLAIVTEAVNTNEQGEVYLPDYYEGRNDPKYSAYHQVEENAANPGGVGFSSARCDDWHSDTGVGSLHVFDTPEKVRHVQKHFPQLYIDHQLIVK